MLNRLHSIISAQWLVHQDSAVSLFPILLHEQGLNEDIFLKPSEEKKPYVVAFSAFGDQVNTVGRWDLDNDDIPENSVAIITLEGMLYSWEYMDLVMRIKRIEANPKISAVLLWVNSPGGMVAGLELVTGAIKSMKKPMVSLIAGLSASAAMWIISATAYRIATSTIDNIGSIGTKMVFDDVAEMLKSNGIKRYEIYATKATRKDEQTRAIAENGDLKPMTEYVDFVNETFHKAISDNLKIPMESEVFTGAIFFAQKAKELGLINEINTMDYALEKAYKLGLKNKAINQSKSLKLY